MEINNGPIPGIYNPAAVVNTTGGHVQGGSSNPAIVHEEKNTSRTLSQTTVMNFANGVPKLSAESAQAIANGAMPPELIVPEDKELDALRNAVKETETLQTNQPDVDDGVIVKLSEAAQHISVQQQSAANDAKIATINAAVNIFTGPDVATAALGNSGGSNATTSSGGAVNVVV